MFEALNEQLAELVARKREKTHIQYRLETLAKELEKAERHRERMHQAWQSEHRDVERLKGLSFGALFYALIGKREEKLSREEEELLEAKLQLEEAEDTVNDLIAEREQLTERFRQLADVESRMAAVMAEKERLIREHHPALAETLDDLTDREVKERAAMKELSEAVSAGNKVLASLERAEEHLRSARSWGTYDMLGGGFLATAIKHNRIDDARSALHAAQAGLKRFRSELRDVARDVQLELEFGSFLTVGDYLFDGLIVDWIVRGKIDEALDKTRRQTARIRSVLADLKRARERALSKLDRLGEERKALIRQA